MKILLVEDDQQVAQLITAVLAEHNYRVDLAADGIEGCELAEAFSYNLIILDVMLPKLDGISFCRRLRSQNNPVPILLLTARDTSTDKQVGLDAGADDYVVKPFDAQELAARVRALLRRGSTIAAPILAWGALQLDPSQCEVTYSGQPLSLTRKEFALMELLLRNKGRVFSRSAIINQLWSFDEPPGEETVKAHIKGLRHKLKAVGAEDLIETLYGQGYRLNPAYDKPAAKTVAAASSPPSKAVTDAIVSNIWTKTRATTFDRLVLLEKAAAALTQGQLDENLRQQAEQAAHKLLGTLGSFGVQEGSNLAKQLEALFEVQGALKPVEMTQVQQLVTKLRQVLEAVPHTSTALPQPPSPSAADADFPLLLVISRDRTLTTALTAEAANYKLRVAIAADQPAAQLQIAQLHPNVVLLDCADAKTEETTLLKKLKTQLPVVPVLIISTEEHWNQPGAIVPLGVKQVLQKPLMPKQIFDAVSQTLQQSRPATVKIMAVDDDRLMLLVLKTVLEPWGVQLTSLQNPQSFWETLEAVQPDLLILDVELPEVSGLELCQAVRNTPRWSWLPILFLSAHSKSEIVHRVFEVGADDYVTKPIVPPELISRIFNRLERTRLLRSMVETDLLTGVLNRQRSSQDLEQFLHLAKHAQQPICLAVVDVDGLQQINRQWGHDIGDRMLRQTGQLLKQKLRPEDVVARWSSSEFVIGIYGIAQAEGVEWLAEILETLRSMQVVTPTGETLSPTFSAGVAQYPVDGTNLQLLYRTAEAASHQAKQAGGDRVLPVGWQPLTETNSIVDVALIHPNSEFAAQVTKALETRGYHVHWLPTEAAATAALTDANPVLQASLILVGGESAECNRFQILKRLRNKALRRSNKNLAPVREASRIILLLSQPDEAEQALQLGAFDYIFMPCTMPVLLQRIQSAMAQKLV